MGPEESRENLVRALLEGEGKAPLEEWLLFLLEPREARSLVRRFALKLKGFRVEKAPLRDLGAALARGLLLQPRLRDEVLDQLVERGPVPTAPPPAANGTVAPVEAAPEWEDPSVALREAEVRRSALETEAKGLKTRLEAAKAQAASAVKRAEEAEAKVRKLNGQLRSLKDLAPRAKDALRLERDLEGLGEENERLRGNCALLHHRVGELEGRLEALEEELRRRVGKGGKPTEKAPPLSVDGTERASVPFLTPEFLGALQNYSDAQIRRILQAVFLACQNPAYSSLNIKKLEGKGEIWSVRAGISLRLFFLREGKVLRFVMVADREDQDAVLHTLRERYA